MIATAQSIDDVQEALRAAEPGSRLLPAGGGTKPALSTSARDDVAGLDLSALRGILEYDPAELTLTALAGTSVQEVAGTLQEHGQHLPFDPPLALAGATLGGVVAAGASGPGAWRHGGVRDFVIGVRFVDGTGRLISGGGRVVKNAAGFDLPKLMVGSAGRLGVMVQLSFKIFPQAAATTTLEFGFEAIEDAVAALVALGRGPVELDALDIAPGARLLVRIGGRGEILQSRANRVMGILGSAAIAHDGDAELALWSDANELTWAPAGRTVVRVGLSARRILALQDELAEFQDVSVWYSVGGTVAWISWPGSRPLDDLDNVVCRLGLNGMVLIGAPDRPLLGAPTGGAFGTRVARAIDPDSRFLEV